MDRFRELLNKIRNQTDYKRRRIDISIPPYSEEIFIQQGEKKRIPYLNILLFLLTIFTTLVAGALMEGAELISDFGSLKMGIPFSFVTNKEK